MEVSSGTFSPDLGTDFQLREPGCKNVWNTDWCVCLDDDVIYDWSYYYSALIKGGVWNTKQVHAGNSSFKLTGGGGV